MANFRKEVDFKSHPFFNSQPLSFKTAYFWENGHDWRNVAWPHPKRNLPKFLDGLMHMKNFSPTNAIQKTRCSTGCILPLSCSITKQQREHKLATCIPPDNLLPNKRQAFGREPMMPNSTNSSEQEKLIMKMIPMLPSKRFTKSGQINATNLLPPLSMENWKRSVLHVQLTEQGNYKCSLTIKISLVWLIVVSLCYKFSSL